MARRSFVSYAAREDQILALRLQTLASAKLDDAELPVFTLDPFNPVPAEHETDLSFFFASASSPSCELELVCRQVPLDARAPDR